MEHQFNLSDAGRSDGRLKLVHSIYIGYAPLIGVLDPISDADQSSLSSSHDSDYEEAESR